MKSSYQIAVLPGDGIGVEVMQAAEQLLGALESRTGVRLDLAYQKAGAQHYLDSGVALPEETLKVCESADAILFGAMGLPHVRGADGTEIIPQLDLRFHFDLYAGVRPIRTFKGLPTPLSHLKASEIDRAREVWSRKFGQPAADAAERARQMRFLAGRGFSSEVIHRAVQGAGDD